MFWFKKGNAETKEEATATAAPKLPERQLAMAEYHINFEIIDGEYYCFKWRDWPSRYLHVVNRPHGQNGLRYRSDGNLVFIPWHQVKKSTLRETLLWDDGKE